MSSHSSLGLVPRSFRIHGGLPRGVYALGGRREGIRDLEGCERAEDSLEGHLELRRQGPPCCCSDIVANLTPMAMTSTLQLYCITIMDATVIEIIN